MEPKLPFGEQNKCRTAPATRKDQWQQIGLPCLLGAALNILGFGFRYDTGNHIYELAMVNWLRDSTLYPHDAIRKSYVTFPSVFWKAVALVPSHLSTEAVLVAAFLATKVVFFYGLTRLARCLSPERDFVSGVAVLFALSPILNIRTPFGYSPVLDPIQTQTPLAIALLVYAGAMLAEGHWLRSTIVTAACFYLNAIYVVFLLFPFGALAVADFRGNKKQVLGSAVVGALIIAPWMLWNRALVGAKYPPEYVPALLLFFPRHLVLSSHNRIDLLYGPAFLCVALVAMILGHKKGIPIAWRLELMACSFAIPVALGVVAGQYHLTPRVASLQFMRADAFLFLYALLLLAGVVYQLAASYPSPYSKVILVGAALICVSPLIPMRFLLLLAGFAIIYRDIWKEVIASAKIWLREKRNFDKWSERLLSGGLLVAMSLVVWATARATMADPRTWTIFEMPRDRGDRFDLQTWARLNTPRHNVFLVPPGEGGFRIESQRSSWGEWKDGTGVYWDPQFAATYVHRMNQLGIYEAPMKASDFMFESYKRQSFESLLTIARENDLQYIVQYSDVSYDAMPVYSNHSFNVYAVRP